MLSLRHLVPCHHTPDVTGERPATVMTKTSQKERLHTKETACLLYDMNVAAQREQHGGLLQRSRCGRLLTARHHLAQAGRML